MASKVVAELPEELLIEADRIAREYHRSRGEVIREVIRVYIAARRGLR